MDWKFEQEWIVMRYFREHYTDFPKGRLKKSESPDFKLWISPKRFIGIEVTQIHPPPLPDPVPGFLDYRHATGQFTSTLKGKEEKIPIYRKQKPDQLWLLIFSEYSESNAIRQILDETRPESFSSGFDRIYLFDLDQHAVYTIK